MPRMAAAGLLMICIVACILPAGVANADYRDDIGYRQLAATLGKDMPTGAGVIVAHTEAPVTVDGQTTWLLDPANPEFTGKRLLQRSPAPPGIHSGHATATARQFYGVETSVAPGITSVRLYSAEGWLGQVLRVSPKLEGRKPRAMTAHVASHSWVADAAPHDGQILRRLDWLIDRDEFIQVVGLTNGGANRHLLANAYNAISAGRSDGSHGRGSVPLDLVYTAGRTRPDLVVPAGTTSEAAPKLAAAVALLVEYAAAHPALATDPAERSTTTRLGAEIHNAGRTEVLRAALMAGARRITANTSTVDLVSYRERPVDQTANGLDRRYGAGQLDLGRSHAILAAGEQNSLEDDRTRHTEVGGAGFDYDPSFGGVGGTNTEATYLLPMQPAAARLTATLAWNLQIAGGTAEAFSGTARRHNLDLELLDLADDGKVVARSASDIENTENLWVELRNGGRYALRVVRGPGQDDFAWDYALAWLTGPLEDRPAAATEQPAVDQ